MDETGKELTELGGRGADDVLAAGRAARLEAEVTHLRAAAESLAGAYDTFARRTLDVQSGKLRVWYEPASKATDKTKEKPFAAYKAEWSAGQQTCDASAKHLVAWRRGGLETTLAPKEEVSRLSALAAACEESSVASRLRAVALAPEAQRESRVTCDGAAGALEASLVAFAGRLKTHCAAVSEHRKLDHAARKAAETLQVLEAKIEECEREVACLARSQSES